MFYYVYAIGVELGWLAILAGAVIACRQSPRVALALQVIGAAIVACCGAADRVIGITGLLVPQRLVDAKFLALVISAVLFTAGYLWERLEPGVPDVTAPRQKPRWEAELNGGRKVE